MRCWIVPSSLQECRPLTEVDQRAEEQPQVLRLRSSLPRTFAQHDSWVRKACLLAAAGAFFAYCGEFAEDVQLAVFYGGGEDEAGDRVAIREEGFDEGFEVGEAGGGDLEEEVVAAGEVVALADFFEGLHVVEEAVVVLAGAAHADEGEDFKAEGFAINFDGAGAEDPDFLHLTKAFAGGGWGEADAAGELGEADTGVSLELGKELSSMDI